MITIYGTSICPFCTRAKNLAKRYKLEHEFKNIDFEHFRSELDEKAAKEDIVYTTVPQIWWYDNYIGGYEDFARSVEETLGGYGEGKI